MPKLTLKISLFSFVLLVTHVSLAQKGYRLAIRGSDRDTIFLQETLGIPSQFPNRNACIEFVNGFTKSLREKGYATASLDSIRFDSAGASAVIFVGDKYQWAGLNTSRVETDLLEAVGWRDNLFDNQPLDFEQIKTWQEKMLEYLENNGYPFAKVYLDSLQIEEEKITALLKIDKGRKYRIDSIRVNGDVKISNTFLQKYLDIKDGSAFNRDKLKQISKKLRDLTYIQEEKPSDLSLLSTGSILNLYLKPKRSSQVNALVGFSPNSDEESSKKLLVTGEATINLHNALGQGETIGLNWQQLQEKSPQLNLKYQHPYLFSTSVGLDFAFDMFRKDSTFLNVNLQLGARYELSALQSGKLFIQKLQTILNDVNEEEVIQNRQLPEEADVNSVNVGIDYSYNNTDYRLNPKKGNKLEIVASVGTKKIKKNDQILELKDPDDPDFDFASLYDTVKLKSYQFRIRLTAEKYFPLGRQSTVKTALNGGWFQSPSIYRNELFQIGGYKLLRGFNEESQYLSQFAVATVEYHYLIGLNSFFYALLDGGWGLDNSQQRNISYNYLGTGLGLAFETKAGIFNLAWAVGKRSDAQLNLRQSKIHFGFVNYF